MCLIKPVVKYANDDFFDKKYLLIEMDRYVVYSIYMALASFFGTTSENFTWVSGKNKARNLADSIAVIGAVSLLVVNSYYSTAKEINLEMLHSIKRNAAFKAILDEPIAQEYTKSGYDESKSIENQRLSKNTSSGCYIATCVYGSYNCPEVWVLRRYRDQKLSDNIFGRVFIRFYYLLSPAIVKLFKNNKLIIKTWKIALDKTVSRLRKDGFSDDPYSDRY
jgi:hypothetical protein